VPHVVLHAVRYVPSPAGSNSEKKRKKERKERKEKGKNDGSKAKIHKHSPKQTLCDSGIQHRMDAALNYTYYFGLFEVERYPNCLT
jgi:hypothetical protein